MRTDLPSTPRARKRWHADLRERGSYLASTGHALLRRRGAVLSPEVRAHLQQLLERVRDHRKDDFAAAPAMTPQDYEALLDEFDDGLTRHLGRWRKSPTREYVEAILWAVCLTLGIRSFVFEAFKIPSGSMIPTLLIHDHIFVNKFIYGIKVPLTTGEIPFTGIRWSVPPIKFFAGVRQPRPGEIVVFEYPYDEDTQSADKDLIKRVVGTPGDRVRIRDNVLTINGRVVPHKVVAADSATCRQPRSGIGLGESDTCRVTRVCLGGYVFTTQNSNSSIFGHPDWPPQSLDLGYEPRARIYVEPDNANFPDFVVPAGQLLVMGDNRDNSHDGRFFGLVPLDRVKGKAGIRWWAFTDDWFKPEWGRMFQSVHEEAPGGTCDNWNPDAVP